MVSPTTPHIPAVCPPLSYAPNTQLGTISIAPIPLAAPQIQSRMEQPAYLIQIIALLDTLVLQNSVSSVRLDLYSTTTQCNALLILGIVQPETIGREQHVHKLIRFPLKLKIIPFFRFYNHRAKS